MFDLDGWFATLLTNGERPVLHVALDIWVIYLATNEALGIEDRVAGVGGICILSSVTDTGMLSERK